MTDFSNFTPDEIRAHRETVLLRLLIRASQAETGELTERLRALGHHSVQTSHIAILGNIDTEGTRLVEVARRVGTTRQAVSQLVKEIEARGFLARRPDPTDGRAVIVGHTPAGRKLLADALAEMAAIEERYESILGTPAMRQLKATLTKLADAVDPAQRL